MSCELWNPFRKGLTYIDFGDTGKLELENVEIYYGTILNKDSLQLISDNKIITLEPWITQRGEVQPIIGIKEKIEVNSNRRGGL